MSAVRSNPKVLLEAPAGCCSRPAAYLNKVTMVLDFLQKIPASRRFSKGATLPDGKA